MEFVATTDDPTDGLNDHGRYGALSVAPTFRPDKLYDFSEEYLELLGRSAGIKIECLSDMLAALTLRLEYFVKKGCQIADHGFERFPKNYADEKEAAKLFEKRCGLTVEEREKLFGFLLVWLTKEYQKRGILMQLHFSVIRNNNKAMFEKCGVDSGFDLIGEEQSVKDLARYFNQIEEEERPETVLYPLNDGNLRAIAAATGAFRHVRMGTAWWFNDTLAGIKRNLETLAEYSLLGNHLGMLTDSRSFSSYSRFDFFRRILCDFVGDKVENGEYDPTAAETLMRNVCYENIKRMLNNG